MSKEGKAMAQLEAMRPTTLRGLAAMLGHLDDAITRQSGDISSALSRHSTVFATLAHAARVLSESR